MKKIFSVIVIAIMSSGYSFAGNNIYYADSLHKNDNGEIVYELIETSGLTKHDLIQYLQAKTISMFADGNNVIQLLDTNSGQILANGMMIVNTVSKKSGTTISGQSKVTFVVDIKVKDNKYMVRLSNFKYQNKNYSASKGLAYSGVHETEWTAQAKYEDVLENSRTKYGYYANDMLRDFHKACMGILNKYKDAKVAQDW